MTHSPEKVRDYIRAQRPDFLPKIAIVLGSGLADFAEQLTDSICINYSDAPGFPVSQVSGHPGCWTLGYLCGMPIICCQGRVHRYEGMQAQDFKLFVRTLKALGCETIVMTNAVGSLRPEWLPGQLVLISDHIHLQPGNPLAGQNDEEWGPRFFPMDNAYDATLRHLFQQTAQEIGVALPEGVYISVLGPCFETPAEIRAFRQLGADVVGMSTVPEVIVAQHCGLKVAVLSVVTNLASGLSTEQITHEGTLHFAAQASDTFATLLCGTLPKLAVQSGSLSTEEK
jgi:xanthosine phosphorylase